MRLIHVYRLAASALAALLWAGVALAQQAPSAAAPNAGGTGGAGGNRVVTAPAPLSLLALIEEAVAQNPEVAAMRRRFDMMRARVPQAKALPDPMLSYGYAGNALPLPLFDLQKGDPASARMLSVTQEIPYPGKLALKGRMANVAAEAEYWEYEQTRLNLIAEVGDAYFDLYYLHKAVETTAKNKGLLEKFARIAEAGYSVGKGMQQDVLKAQVEISKLTEELLLLEQRREVAEARLNARLFREPGTPVGRPEDLKPREFTRSLSELQETALESHPALRAQRRRVDREQYGVGLARKEFYPDFTVGLTYFNRPGMPEMYGATVGVRVPLWFWQKQRPAVAEAAASAAAEKQRAENTTSLLFYRIKDRHLAATTAGRLVKLYGTTIIPQATLSLEAAIAGYEAGKADFLTLLDNLVTLRTYELSYYEQLANVEKAFAALEPLVGVPLRP
jgi:cobalt-zinc-cadmium efflux system outer membrane protein